MSEEIKVDKKVTIETLSDFLKIPFSKIKSTKLSNFNGKFFDELYQNALKIERGEVNHKEIEKDDIDLENIDDNYSVNIQMMHNPLYQNDNNKKLNNNHMNNNFENDNNSNYEKNNNQNNEKLRNKEMKKNKNNNNIKNNQINNNNKRINRNNEINRNQNMNINNNNNNNTIPNQGLSLHKVTFQIEYATIFGEEIAISGSGNSLGNWDQNKVFKLKWTNGNIWKGSISLNEYNFSNFEFKFVLLSNNKIKTWENGGNNIVNFNNIYQVVLKNRKGKFSKYEYEYINDELILNCKWS